MTSNWKPSSAAFPFNTIWRCSFCAVFLVRRRNVHIPHRPWTWWFTEQPSRECHAKSLRRFLKASLPWNRKIFHNKSFEMLCNLISSSPSCSFLFWSPQELKLNVKPDMEEDFWGNITCSRPVNHLSVWLRDYRHFPNSWTQVKSQIRHPRKTDWQGIH